MEGTASPEALGGYFSISVSNLRQAFPADFLILFSHNTCPCQNLWNRAESSQMDRLCLRIRKYQPCTPNLPSGTLPVHLSPMYHIPTCFQLPRTQALVFLSQECLLYSFSLIIPLSVLAFYRRCLNIGP